MFLGHFAVGFGSQRFAPRVPLPILLIAALFSDILGPTLSLLGWEHARIAPGRTQFVPLDLYDIPWSHSLLTTVIWATVLALIYWLAQTDVIGSIVIWLDAASHWMLDWITHRPDLPLAPGMAAHYGLGLWNSIAGTMAVEIGMFGLAMWMYTLSTEPQDRVGKYMLISYSVALLLVYVSIPFSSPPTIIRQMDFASLSSTIVFVNWAWWISSHRCMRK